MHSLLLSLWQAVHSLFLVAHPQTQPTSTCTGGTTADGVLVTVVDYKRRRGVAGPGMAGRGGPGHGRAGDLRPLHHVLDAWQRLLYGPRGVHAAGLLGQLQNRHVAQRTHLPHLQPLDEAPGRTDEREKKWTPLHQMQWRFNDTVYGSFHKLSTRGQRSLNLKNGGFVVCYCQHKKKGLQTCSWLVAGHQCFLCSLQSHLTALDIFSLNSVYVCL